MAEGYIHGNSKAGALSTKFLDTLNENFLYQHVQNATFGNSILDLIITDEYDSIYAAEIGAPLGETSKNRLHSTLCWDYLVRGKLLKNVVRKTLYSNSDYDSFSELFFERLGEFQITGEAETMYSQLLSINSEGVNRFVPVQIKSIEKTVKKCDPKWFNAGIKKLTKLKYKLFILTRINTNDAQIKSEYRTISKKVRHEVKEARLRYEWDIVTSCKSNPKKIYSYINGQRKIRDKIRALSDQSGLIVTNKIEIANMLNNQFYNAFSRDSGAVLPILARKCENKCLVDLRIFSAKNIYEYLIKLNQDKTPGADGLHPAILKNCALPLSQYLEPIFTNSYLNGTIPRLWKEANISPIHKKGSRLEPSNYRPVSLTSVVSKVMERIIRDRMVSHLEEFNLIAREQHGFVRKKSCLTNLLEAIDAITEALSKGFTSVIIFLDFAKAFDKVCHRALIKKLELYGFNDNLLNWIAEFLKNRRQRVVLGEAVSDWCDVLSGVPQGSVIGPLLFVIFINDLPGAVMNLCKLFADDTKVIGIIRNPLDIQVLQDDIYRLLDWSEKWLMSFNDEKCTYMVFNNKFFTFDFEMNGKSLRESECERDLGIYLNNKLKWNYQATMAANRAFGVLGQLKKAFKYWTKSTFKRLYFAFVRPHLEYAIAAWNPHTKQDIKVLEKVQRRATKLVVGLKGLNYEERLNKLGLTTLKVRRTRGDLIEYFKICKNMSVVDWHNPNKLCNSLEIDGPAGNIRGFKHRITKQLTTCSARQTFILNRIVDSWNRLPPDVIDAKSVTVFKERLDRFLSGATAVTIG